MATREEPVNSLEFSRRRERVAVGCRDDALEAWKARCEVPRESRQVAAFGVGVASEENLKAEGVRAEHIMVRQLASQETGRALRGRRVEQARAAPGTDGNHRMCLRIRTACKTSSCSIDSAASEHALEAFRQFRGKTRFGQPCDPSCTDTPTRGRGLERHDVEGRLLVGMRRAQRLEHRMEAALVERHLEPQLGDALEPPRLSDRGVRA